MMAARRLPHRANWPPRTSPFAKEVAKAMQLRSAALVVLMSLAARCSLARAENWPRFRGTDGAGLSAATTLPVAWTEKDYTWRVTLPGSGHSSPVVWGSRIFLTCADKRTARRTVCCLRAADGRLLWRRDYESARYRQHTFNHFASASPAADADRVYATWTAPKEVTLLALSHDGRDVWRRDLGRFAAQHGSATSPIVVGDVVVLANDQRGTSSLLALDRATGRTRWQRERRSTKCAYGTPCVFRPKDGPPQLIFTSTAHGVTSVDPRTGEANWELADAFPERCASSPVVASGLIVGTCGVGGRGVRGVAVRPGSKGRAPEIAYTLDKPLPYVVSAVTHGDLLFLWSDEGTVTCLRGATGERVWRQKLRTSFFGSPVRAGDRLYCISKKGEVFVVAAAAEFKLLARNPLGELSYATPAIANGTMYLRTLTHLIAIGGKR